MQLIILHQLPLSIRPLLFIVIAHINLRVTSQPRCLDQGSQTSLLHKSPNLSLNSLQVSAFQSQSQPSPSSLPSLTLPSPLSRNSYNLPIIVHPLRCKYNRIGPRIVRNLHQILQTPTLSPQLSMHRVSRKEQSQLEIRLRRIGRCILQQAEELCLIDVHDRPVSEVRRLRGWRVKLDFEDVER